VLDWRHVERTDASALAEEAGWARRQNLTVLVDFTSGANLYPDLRFCNNSATQCARASNTPGGPQVALSLRPLRYERSLARVEDVMTKMTAVAAVAAGSSGAHLASHAIFSLHRTPENYYPSCDADFAAAAARLAASAVSAQHRLE
jgi:hypothetical protein